MMRQGNVYYKDRLAGTITETDEGDYVFKYNVTNPETSPYDFITFTVRKEPYIDNGLFPFFEGLIPEGWLLDIAMKIGKLIAMTVWGYYWPFVKICIGAVSIIPNTL